ncbi:MAG: DUF1761 domain-containing protein [Promethearchaeota archaeon]|jgi:hypothetical protein
MNIWAVLVVTAVEFFLGFLWYSKFILGNLFLKHLGKSQDEVQMKPLDGILSVVASFLMFLFFAILLDLMGTFDLVISLALALVVWVGFIATSNYYGVIYEGRNKVLYLIFILYKLVGLLIGALILGLWP